MHRFFELMLLYWSQNIGPFLVALVLVSGFAKLFCRLLHWDMRLVLAALAVLALKELYQFIRFLVEYKD